MKIYVPVGDFSKGERVQLATGRTVYTIGSREIDAQGEVHLIGPNGGDLHVKATVKACEVKPGQTIPKKPRKAAKTPKPTLSKTTPPMPKDPAIAPAHAVHDTIWSIDPNLIDLAPELAAVPMMGAVAAFYNGSAKPANKVTGQEISAELNALFANLDEEGIQEPLKATLLESGRWKLWDGRHRLLWAAQTGRGSVPVMEVTEDEGRALIEATVVGRRHWLKGQRAYLGVLLHPEVAGAAAHRPKKNTDPIGVTNATELATRLGVSQDTVLQAVELYRKFYAPGKGPKTPEAIQAQADREKYEMSIWAGMGLGGVIAGIGGGNATGGGPKKASGFHGLDKPLGTLVTFGKAFVKWPEDERAKAMKLMVVRFKEGLSPEFRLALSEALAAADA